MILHLHASEEKSSFDKRLVQFPPKQVLKNRLKQIGFDEFDLQTDLVESLYNIKPSKNPTGIAMHVECAYDIFVEIARENNTPEEEITTKINNKPVLYETLLHNHPAGLKEIESTGLYKPKKIVLTRAKSL